MSLTLSEARQRAGVLSSVSYDLDLDLTRTEAFHSRTTVRFSSASAETFLELAGALAATSADAGELRGWLDTRRVADGVPLLPRMRWALVARLAALGAADADLIAAEREGDDSVEADLGAARALAARPSAEAKATAWARLSEDPGISNRMFGAVGAGLWSPEQTDLLRPYVDAYVAEAPRLARRGQAFAGVVGQAFPAIALDDGQLRSLEQALAGDVPTVLRRAWEDHLDDRIPTASRPQFSRGHEG